MHVPCLKQECVLGSVILPNMGPLRDQYYIVMVKFLGVGCICRDSLNEYEGHSIYNATYLIISLVRNQSLSKLTCRYFNTMQLARNVTRRFS